MEKLSTNILLLGKSGAGKSALLNYMYGERIHKVGAGAPQTQKGLFPEEYAYGKDFTMQIYDTWGVEAGKDREWEELIFEEVKLHEKHHIREWFSTVIMCFSALERFETFEEEVIRRFLTEYKTHVTVAITHCRDENDPRGTAMKEEVLRAINREESILPEKDVILVNCVKTQPIGSPVAFEVFGREEIFESIIRNLWNAFKTKVPFKVRKYVDRRFEEKKAEFEEEIIGRHFGFRKMSAIEEIEADINRAFEEFIKDIVVDTNAHFCEAATYYQALSRTYADIGLQIDAGRFATKELKFNAFDQFEDEIRSILESLKRSAERLKMEIRDKDDDIVKILVEIRAFFARRKRVQRELVLEVGKYLDKMKKSLYQQIDEVEDKIQGLDFSEVIERQR